MNHSTFLLMAGLLSLLAGCGSAPEPGVRPVEAPQSKATAEPNPFDAVKKGMTASEVRKLVGEPKEIKPFKASDLKNSEVWVYQHKVAERTRLVTVGTREVPVADTMTGKAGVIQESVLGNEYLTVPETVELLMIEGQLIELKRKPKLDRSLN